MSSNFIWLVELKCVLQSLKEGWGVHNLLHSTECYSGSGFDVMFMSERWLLILNMAMSWVSGVLMRLMGLIWWGFGRLSGGGWGEFSSHTRFEVGDGSKIRLWYDVWCADQALKVTFLDLFSLAHCKDAVVADLLEFF
jgi:hypothetical protein